MVLESIATFIAEKVGGCLLRPIEKWICNMYNFQSNIDNLKKQAKELELKKKSVMDDVEYACRQGDSIKGDVSEWLSQVDEFDESLANVTNAGDEDRAKQCFKVLSCPNFKTRYSHSMEVVKLAEDVADLLNKGVFPRVGNYNPPQRTRSVYVNENDDFASRRSIFDVVMETLKNTDVKAIGLHGMGGVGKTTLVKRVYWELTKERLFDQVVMAEVTQNPDLMQIQGAIADDLGLKFQEQSVNARAARLRERLKKEKNVLVILDDLWKELDLDAVGIPFGSADQTNLRLLLTSRNLGVCNDMEIQKNIYVSPLSPDEAMNLFWRIVDNSAKRTRFEPTTVETVEKCGYLPVAVSAIASALKDKDDSVWIDVLDEVKYMNFGAANEKVSPVIELSYKYLENRDAKSLFLLCGLHEVGQPIHIEQLVRHVIGLGLFRHANTLKAVKGKVHKLIKDLKTASLLLDEDRKDSVKVHDVIHAVAQDIASRDKLFSIQDDSDLELELEKDMYKDSEAISLPAVNGSQLPAMLELPQLKLLSLIRMQGPSKIPDHFFDGMKKLKVLDLARIHLPSLTLSLAYLMNLQTLCFRDCRLGDISVVGKLKKLEVLSFFGSDIKKLPEEIGELTRLKCLDLQHCLQLKAIPPNVLSKLTNLEELLMGNSFVKWDVEDNASLIELKQLNQLTVLNIHIMNVNIIPKDLLLKKLETYVILIGGTWKWYRVDRYEMSKVLKLKFNDSHKVEHGVTMLLKKTEDLYLDDLKGLKNVYPELGREGFVDLKSLRVQNDPHILHIAKGQLMAESFGKLKTIEVQGCATLTHLFSVSAVKNFSCLEEIDVRDCTNLKEIVGKESDEDDMKIKEIVFTKFHTLRLDSLPKLMHFDHAASTRPRDRFEEDNQEDFMVLFGRKASFPSLKNLYLNSLEIRSIWSNQLPSTCSFSEKLTSLVVDDCGGLKFLFTSSMVNLLRKLEELVIVQCESMEVIVKMNGSRGENNIDGICFPSLKRFVTARCRNLKSFSSSSMYACKTAENEPAMLSSTMSEITNPFFNEKIVFPALEELRLSSVNTIEYLFADCAMIKERIIEETEKDATADMIIFPKLQLLCLSDLPELKGLCGFTGHVIEMSSLTELLIRKCPKMQTLVSDLSKMPKEVNSKENLHGEMIPLFDEKILLLNLKSLSISFMKNLRRLWHNKLCQTSFSRLEKLDVWGCANLSTVFPHNMLDRLGRLMHLTLKYCDSLEEIFDVLERSSSVEENTIFRIILPKLTQLTLDGLPNLKSFYHGLHILEWPSLKELVVKSCDNMEIFGSEFQSLQQENKHVPQPLFIVDEGAFPKLEQLDLCYNDKLKEIWHGGYTDQLPFTVKKLLFKKNPSVAKFPHYLLNTSLAVDEFSVSPVFFKQIVGGCDNTFAAALSQLRALTVYGWGEQNSETSNNLTCLVSSWVTFQNMTELRIGCCSGFKYLLTYPTAKSLQQVTKLEIYECDMLEEIIMPPADEVNDEIIFSQLKDLELDNLPSLTSFYSGSHILKFPSLEKVIVAECPNMKVFSEGVSVTPELQEIQCTEDDEGLWEGDLNNTVRKMFKEMVGFEGLWEVKLSKFSHLKEIWHGQFPFGVFDKLVELSVDKCAEFSSAVPTQLLPFLKNLRYLIIEACDSLEEVCHLEGLHADDHSVLLPRLIKFSLVELPRLRNIWSKRHLEMLGFTELRKLYVSKCNSLQYIFTSTIILNLKQLQRVEIRECAMVETIITEDRGKNVAMNHIKVPELEFIVLESLPKLTCFHSGSNVLECSSLETVTITDCPKMKTFIFASTEDLDLDQDAPLFSEKVTLPSLEVLKLSKLPKVKRLWNEHCKAFQKLATIRISECINLNSLVPSSASLQSLMTLEISQCDALTSLVTLPTAKSLEQLTRINIADCKIMGEIITHVGDEENDLVVLGKLEHIELNSLPSITGFYLGDCTIDFPALDRVVLRQCPKMSTFSKGVVNTPKLQRVQLLEAEEERRLVNDLNTTIQQMIEETTVHNAQEH